MQVTGFIYRLCIALWLGGASLFTFVLTPAIFRSFNRDLAGKIVGVLFPGYFRWGLACGVVALAALYFFRGRHPSASAVIIVVMLLVTAVQAFHIEPKAADLKRRIPSFETVPPDDPLRSEFRRLHAASAAGNLGVIGGGFALLLLL